MVDWEFWGNKKALLAIAIGLLLTVGGIVLGLAFNAVCLGLALVGVVVMCIASYYLEYWENWELLQERKKYE